MAQWITPLIDQWIREISVRKLKPGEVVALVAVMAIGSGNVHADENIPGRIP
jgi:hypothetical protein